MLVSPSEDLLSVCLYWSAVKWHSCQMAQVILKSYIHRWNKHAIRHAGIDQKFHSHFIHKNEKASVIFTVLAIIVQVDRLCPTHALHLTASKYLVLLIPKHQLSMYCSLWKHKHFSFAIVWVCTNNKQETSCVVKKLILKLEREKSKRTMAMHYM